MLQDTCRGGFAKGVEGPEGGCCQASERAREVEFRVERLGFSIAIILNYPGVEGLGLVFRVQGNFPPIMGEANGRWTTKWQLL